MFPKADMSNASPAFFCFLLTANRAIAALRMANGWIFGAFLALLTGEVMLPGSTRRPAAGKASGSAPRPFCPPLDLHRGTAPGTGNARQVAIGLFAIQRAAPGCIRVAVDRQE